jgi:Mg-chelatase subunit ChlD
MEKPQLLRRLAIICSICAIALCLAFALVPLTHAGGQSRARRPPPVEPQKKPATETPSPTPEAVTAPEPEPTTEESQDIESLKIDTNLVTVPVIATTRDGNYIADLTQDEFSIAEDGEKQQIAFFATVSAPFHVVLMLDTSASTDEKLGQIRKAATAFVEQLQRADRVKVISFDNELRELCEFTNDRAVLSNAINKTVSGTGTRLYDAFDLALASIRTIKGRKAIVLFTDGVDFHSDMATYNTSLHGLDEEGVVVYPIRYETRAETERIAREATEGDPGSTLPTIDVIRPGSGKSTPKTFPSDDPDPIPTSGGAKTGPFGLPSAAEILRKRRQQDPNQDRYPPGQIPPNGPTDPTDDRRHPHDPNDPLPDPRDSPGSTTRRTSGNGDAIDVMIDQLYLTADSYLKELAEKSGGRVLRADTLGSLPDAFAKIAAELRTQYALGYYPTNKARNGAYRKIKVSTTRKNAAVRARPGYRAPSGG